LLRFEKGLLDPGRYSPLSPATDIEFEGRVDTIHTLVIPGVSHSPQAEVGLPEADGGVLLHQLMEPEDNLLILAFLSSIPVRAGTQMDSLAGLTMADPMFGDHVINQAALLVRC
jgi:hypothetical protein